MCEQKMAEYLIQAKDLSLIVPTYKPSQRDLLSNPARLLADLYLTRDKRESTTLLDKLNFTVRPGERVGIIGSNGAGKSTLLRVLAGIYPVSEGVLSIRGNAQGLFDVRFGMDFEGTGLENVYLRGLQMGLTLREIRALIPSVIEFAELDSAITDPIRIYSTGMLLRLGFAISTMIEPDILLLDEWIGSSDARFRAKTQQRMNELIDNSRGLILATHNIKLMESLCDRAIVLVKGKIVFEGPVGEAHKRYQKVG